MKSDHDPEPRSSFLARYGTLVARLLFAPLLLGYVAMKVRALMGSVQADALQSFPMAQVALYLTILVEFAGGMMLVLGYRTRLAAAAVIVLFVGVTALMLPMVGAPGGMGMACTALGVHAPRVCVTSTYIAVCTATWTAVCCAPRPKSSPRTALPWRGVGLMVISSLPDTSSDGCAL